MTEKSADYRWVEQVIMAGLRMIGEDRNGERLETFGDLFDEHDKVMGLLRVVNFEYEDSPDIVFGEEAILKDPQ